MSGLCDVVFFKKKTAYEMRISDWSSDVCSSDLSERMTRAGGSDRSTSIVSPSRLKSSSTLNSRKLRPSLSWPCMKSIDQTWLMDSGTASGSGRSRTRRFFGLIRRRSEEHTSELQSLMRISYAVFCLKKKKNKQ